MSKWSRIYSEQINKEVNLFDYISKKLRYKKKLINIVKKYSDCGEILEAGCGTGISGVYLTKIGKKVTCLDQDKDMLILAKRLSQKLEIKLNFKQGNIKQLPFNSKQFNVSFSNGVLEHFSNSEIVKIINEQLRVSKYMVFSVPSNFFTKGQRIYGDERFMNILQWKKIIKKSNSSIILEFAFDFKSIKDRFHYYLCNLFKKNIKKSPPFIGWVLSNR
jgi:ubiquinone/menaquinone biosynthesis C-methylase UbiE